MKTIKINTDQFVLKGFIIATLLFGFTACSDDDNGNTNDNPANFNLSIQMEQTVNGQAVAFKTPNMPYTNQMGQKFNINRLRYLISKLHFHGADGSDVFVDGFFFVDLDDSTSLSFQPTTPIPEGEYTSVAFYFGFDKEDNIKDFPELNVANWNWPEMLGGGYHNMQLEGQYDSAGTAKNFATHFGTARDQSVNPTTFTNTAVEVEEEMGITVNSDFTLTITMQVEQWYENPFQWDFNVWNAPIMPIFDAQMKLKDNSSTVFTISIN